MLPAYAGMIPHVEHDKPQDASAPRVCGDDPTVAAYRAAVERCSLRMRG